MAKIVVDQEGMQLLVGACDSLIRAVGLKAFKLVGLIQNATTLAQEPPKPAEAAPVADDGPDIIKTPAAMVQDVKPVPATPDPAESCRADRT